jgi:AraC-like DNA-binding protein
MVFEEFYLNYLKGRSSKDPLDIYSLIKLNNQIYFNPELQLIFRQIKRSMESGITSELYYESKLMEILYLITSEVSNGSFQKNVRKRRLTEGDLVAVNKAKSIIDERLSVSPKISELAFLTNTSVSKLQSDFQLAFGSTIHGYVQKSRMKEALHKIDSTDEALYAIAKSVGCKNPSHFAEIFKKTYGMTPMEYRNLKTLI